jgi:hypothetical protein
LLFVLFYCYFCCSMHCLYVNVYCHRVTTQLQLTNMSISKSLLLSFSPLFSLLALSLLSYSVFVSLFLISSFILYCQPDCSHILLVPLYVTLNTQMHVYHLQQARNSRIFKFQCPAGKFKENELGLRATVIREAMYI